MNTSRCRVIALCLISGFLLMSCSTEEQSSRPKPCQIILDTDIGSSYDDLVALSMLFVYQERGQCDLMGVVVDRMGEDCASVADIMNTWYGHPDLPLALVRDGIADPEVWIDYRDMALYRGPDGNLLYPGSGRSLSDLPDGYKLYRKLLSESEDNSVSICSIGFVTALAQLLESDADEYSDLSGVELVRRKVKCLYMMAGVFDGSMEPDYNLSQGLSFARTFFSLWPGDVDVIMSPSEVGQMLDYTPQQVKSDLPSNHPLHEMLLRCVADDGQRMWDPLTVINAVEGDSLFSLSSRGKVLLRDDASTVFCESSEGNYRHQLPGSQDWNAGMLQRIRSIMRN
ncbi:MAG: nucleoside hydrolase [Candidatus Cryptobacteroides sp.]